MSGKWYVCMKCFQHTLGYLDNSPFDLSWIITITLLSVPDVACKLVGEVEFSLPVVYLKTILFS